MAATAPSGTGGAGGEAREPLPPTEEKLAPTPAESEGAEASGEARAPLPATGQKPLRFSLLRSVGAEEAETDAKGRGVDEMMAAIGDQPEAIKYYYEEWKRAEAAGRPESVWAGYKTEWQTNIDWVRRQDIVVADNGDIDENQFKARMVEYLREQDKQSETRVHFSGGQLYTNAQCTDENRLETDGMVTHSKGLREGQRSGLALGQGTRDGRPFG